MCDTTTGCSYERRQYHDDGTQVDEQIEGVGEFVTNALYALDQVAGMGGCP
uniref:hypothetical protein n=1 Tax=Oceanimonas baumannii TaxID=129578 RepID=UPI001FD1B7A5|nr:hypothetical protein [Oceanimonas baumannii]